MFFSLNLNLICMSSAQNKIILSNKLFNSITTASTTMLDALPDKMHFEIFNFINSIQSFNYFEN